MKECPICWYHYDNTRRDRCPTCGTHSYFHTTEHESYDMLIVAAHGARRAEDYAHHGITIHTGTVDGGE